jgi:hypothetical protein
VTSCRLPPRRCGPLIFKPTFVLAIGNDRPLPKLMQVFFLLNQRNFYGAQHSSPSRSSGSFAVQSTSWQPVQGVTGCLSLFVRLPLSCRRPRPSAQVSYARSGAFKVTFGRSGGASRKCVISETRNMHEQNLLGNDGLPVRNCAIGGKINSTILAAT